MCGAVIAGFLLTAVPNWTGRLPIQGGPLAISFASWLAGRLAVTILRLHRLANRTGGRRRLFCCCSLPWAAREIVAGRKWNNLKVVGIISLLAVANIAFHVEAHLDGLADYSTRFGVVLVVTLVCVIGGRIVPSFTRNWMARREPGRLPVPFNRFDAITMVAGVCAMIAWVVAPSGRLRRSRARRCRLAPRRPPGSLGRPSDRVGPPRADPPCGLRVRPCRFPAGGAICSGLRRAQRRHPCWTGRRDRFDDDRGDDPCFARPHRAGAFGVHRSLQLRLRVGSSSRRWRGYARHLSQPHSVPLLMIAGVAWAGAFLGFALAYGPLLYSARKSEVR